MPTQILATASIAANSADVVVTSDLAVALKGIADSGALVIISLKDDAGAYQPIGRLTSNAPVTVISAPGTYRFARVAGSACGVFSG